MSQCSLYKNACDSFLRDTINAIIMYEKFNKLLWINNQPSGYLLAYIAVKL